MCINMEKITAENGKIYLISGGQKYRKDSDLVGNITSWRCVRSACRGRLKIGVNDEIVSSSEHNHEPNPEVKKSVEPRQITASDSDRMHRTGKWLLFEPTEIEKPLSKLDDIFHREANPYSDSLNRNKSKTKDVAVQTDPDTAKDFPLKMPSLKNSVDELLRNPNAWNQPALRDKLNATAVPVRIKGGKRIRLNKEYVWHRY